MSYSTFIPALRQWLTPPTFPDKEQTRAARWLNILLLMLSTLIILDSIGIVIGLLDQDAMAQIIMTNAIALMINLATLRLMRNGHVKIAAIILLASLYVLITYLYFTRG